MDTAATETAAAPAAPAARSPADLAGTWNGRTMPLDNDNVLTTWQLTATDDTTGWTFTLTSPAKRGPMPVRVVAVEGDSIVAEFGPFESVLRKGVQVRNRTVYRLQGDRLVGTTVARYQTSGPDSLRHFRTEATRAP